MRPRKNKKSSIVSSSLNDVYAHVGEYKAKMILDLTESLAIESVIVDIRNSDGKSMDFDANRWGTKISLSFNIDSSTPDGVSIVDVMFNYHNRQTSAVRERFSFWVIKD